MLANDRSSGPAAVIEANKGADVDVAILSEPVAPRRALAPSASLTLLLGPGVEIKNRNDIVCRRGCACHCRHNDVLSAGSRGQS